MILAFVAQVRRERLAEYAALHAAPWPEHMAVLKAAHIEDYTIHLDEPRALLFARFTYTGTDLNADMARVDAHPVACAWDAVTRECMLIPEGATDAWVALSPVFRLA